MRPHERLASDLRLAATFGRAAPGLMRAWPGRGLTVADVLGAGMRRHPARAALICGDETVTYGQLDARSNQVARWAIDQGIGRGDVVGLFMSNRPEYVVYWLGLAKVGAVSALINTNLRGRSLAHSVMVAGADTVIVDGALAEAWATGADELSTKPAVWSSGAEVNGADDLDVAAGAQSAEAVDRAVRKGLGTADRLFYIYTSGTTGLPKAANFSHLRFIGAAEGARALTQLGRRDRMYIALPLYHTAGGVMALGAALTAGATAVIAPRFSVSTFWDDCVEHDVTVFQYIGEMCRYLVNSAPHPLEREHRIRVCVGNGLRPEVWEPFQQRFAIPHIIEFYSATEGNVSLLNVDDKVGGVGRMPALMRRAVGLHLIHYDVEADEVIRDADGRCIEAGVDEVGEAIGRITSTLPFEGYSDPEATEAKVLRDVFRTGDAYFRTGDLLRRDGDDYFYFVDRVGDTFRWKGENVATTEVGEVLSTAPGVCDATAYGVPVPHTDGRAGMAALVVDDEFDVDELLAAIEPQLASYARPLFLRIRTELEITGTFKHRKIDLVNDGFDPNHVDDDLYVLDPAENRYVCLDDNGYQRIEAGELKF